MTHKKARIAFGVLMKMWIQCRDVSQILRRSGVILPKKKGKETFQLIIQLNFNPFAGEITLY